ncbi:hypothetical protein NUM3379_33600 [Kineococcus sp. NUM-3379]
MSSVWHPVGPAGARTYWRRRLVLLVVLAALVTGVVALVGRGGGESTPAGAAALALSPTAPAPSTSAAPDAVTTPSEQASGPAGPCEPADLEVGVTTDAVRYGRDAKPLFTLLVENASDAPCTAELGAGLVRFEVLDAAGVAVWNSRHCSTGTDARPVRLPAGEVKPVVQVWQGARSADGCPPGQPRVEPGEYTVSAHLGDVAAQERSFTVR